MAPTGLEYLFKDWLVWRHFKGIKIPLKETWHYLVIGIIGAIVGAVVAIHVSPDGFKLVYKYLVLALLVLMIIQSKKWTTRVMFSSGLKPWIYIPVFLALGFYGGFIQMGMGIFFLQ